MWSMLLTVVVSARSRDGDDAVGHLLRGEALVLPHDAHHRNVDVGKDIDRRVENRERAEDQEQQRKNGKGIGPSQRESNNPHRL